MPTSSLQGTLQMSFIFVDFNVETSQSLEAVYINSGDNPFELLKDSIKILEKHKGTLAISKTRRFHSTWTGLDGALGMLSTLKSVHKESKRVFKVNEFSKEGEPFIEGTHYFSSCSVDGVKFVIQNLMETLGSGVGGWVSLTRFYEEALEQSIARNFKYNNLFLIEFVVLSLKETAVARASEDFMPREPTFQTLHIASVAFNSLLLGEIVSKHDTAEFHAAATAIGGCAAHVSDKPGKQDFKILRKLVFPDGSVLRSRYAGWPARDCLFLDPVLDRKSMLKIWNLNKLSGVIGVFNCQGAGSWPHNEVAQDICNATSTSSSIACHVSPHDVEFLEEVYYISGSVTKLPRKGLLEVSLKTLTCELYTISPIKVFGNDLLFAPLGFLDMYNSGGAVEALNCTKDLSSCTIKIKG
uniref:Uncharacterized protein n=1 Tax=Quercus lobata TaxID=97700 RepID=A0A7N2MMH3_QUELO